MRSETKKRILEVSLTLFSERGYEAATMADIANAVGIKAPSLYKHYKGKRDIFESLLKEMSERYRDFANENKLEGENPDTAAAEYADTDLEGLVSAAYGLFQYFLHDPYASRFRRLLTLESFRSPEMAKLFVAQYIDAPTQFQGTIFGIFMRQGFFKDLDPQVAAYQFYSPVFLLLNLCDNSPEREPEALDLIRRHIEHFSVLYSLEGREHPRHGEEAYNG
jgi:AcrR family transcriptional regulator